MIDDLKWDEGLKKPLGSIGSIEEKLMVSGGK